MIRHLQVNCAGSMKPNLAVMAVADYRARVTMD